MRRKTCSTASCPNVWGDMTAIISRLREKYRNAKRRIGVWYDRDELSNAQLGELARHGELLIELTKHPGWTVYRDSVLDRIDDQIDRTMLLPAEKFASVEGVECKGVAMGARMALNVVGEVISRGMDADARLKERLRKANGKKQKPLGSRLGVPIAE